MARKKTKRKKKTVKRKRIVSGLLIFLFLALGGTAFYLHYNFNKLISSKIYTLYNQSEAANYYSLRFNKLRVNLISMNVRVYGVQFEARKELHQDYFEKNGRIEVKIGKITLKNASLFAFLSSNTINIEDFLIKDPKISIYKTTENFQPFDFIKKEKKNDSLTLLIHIQNIDVSKAQLFYYRHSTKETENSFKNFNMEVKNIQLSKNQSFDFSFEKLLASLDGISYRSKKGSDISMKQFQVGIINFKFNNKDGQFQLNFDDLNFRLLQPQFITADSLYTITAAVVAINKKHKELSIHNVLVHPNMDKNDFVRSFKYQKIRPELEIQDIRLVNIDFHKIIDNKGLFADSLLINGVETDLFKSKKIPLNRTVVPHYLALQIRNIKYPIAIKLVQANDVNINFSLQQKDGRISAININKISVKLHNVQNQNKAAKLRLIAKGSIQNSMPFSLILVFNYNRDYFTFKGQVYKSRLSSLSKTVLSFAPVEIKKGLLHSMKFQGVVNQTDSRGEMTFLYNNLNIKIQSTETEKENRFSNSILSIAANTYLLSNNPASKDLPPRKVAFKVARDMNKGFIHILIQSILGGIEETISPSRENRQHYKKVKKQHKGK